MSSRTSSPGIPGPEYNQEAEYIHQPLQSQRSIRVIELLPAKPGAPLRCQISEVSLENPPHYEALSYAWGALEFVKTTTCNSKVIRITRSCSHALHSLRKLKKSRLLWVDSICIDQKSPNERNHQVGMMGEVYSKARRVVVWLGRGQQGGWYDSNAAMKYMRGTIKRNKVGSWSKHEGLDKEKISDLNRLFGTPWFQRVWPVQEVAMSRACVILLGNSYIDVEDLMTFLTIAQMHTFTEEKLDRVHLHRQMWRYVQHVRRNSNSRQRITNCTRMLLRTRPQSASDPRDKIFAFHGLLEILGAQFPVPDYTKPVAQVYREATATAIHHDNSLLILSALTGERKLDSLPSWVPDWSDSDCIREVASWGDARATDERICLPAYNISADGKLLRLQGTIVELVSQPSLAFPDAQHLYGSPDFWLRRSELEVLQQWLHLFTDGRPKDMVSFFTDFATPAWKNTHPLYLSVSTLVRLWIRGIYSLKQVSVSNPSCWSLSQTVDRDLVSTVLRLIKGDSSVDASIVKKHMMPFHTVVRKLLDRKVMFKTENGRLGIGSRSLHSGDSIAIFAGCNLPMIIRKAGQDGRWYLVAPAYLNEKMDASVGQGYSSSREQLQPFTFI